MSGVPGQFVLDRVHAFLELVRGVGQLLFDRRDSLIELAFGLQVLVACRGSDCFFRAALEVVGRVLASSAIPMCFKPFCIPPETGASRRLTTSIPAVIVNATCDGTPIFVIAIPS